MRKMINGERFVMGTCYYPEHWDSSMWEDDLERSSRRKVCTPMNFLTPSWIWRRKRE